MSLKAILGSAAGALSGGLRPPTDSGGAVAPAGRASGGATALAIPLLARTGGSLAGLQRLADQHLQAASQMAAGELGRWSAYGQGLQAAQDALGDLTGQAQSAAAAVASGGGGTDGPDQAQAVFVAAREAGERLGALSGETDAGVQARLAGANDLLAQIATLNRSVGAARLAGQDASAAQSQQTVLAGQLSSLIGGAATRRADGGLEIRAADGTRLAGDTAASLAYAVGAAGRGGVTVQAAGAPEQAFAVDSGEVAGLLELRNTKLPQMSAQLVQVGQAAGQAAYAGTAGAGAAAAGLSRTAQAFADSLSRDTAGVQKRQATAQAVATEADGRRRTLAGLDVNQELAALAAYQQAASAAGQMSDGAKDLTQALAAAA